MAKSFPRIFIGPHSLFNFEKMLDLEWIITNGLGGYASSTVLNINSRKYHGLLIASLNPPVKRHLLLSKIDEEFSIANNKHPFYSNEYQNSIYPAGFKKLLFFELNPFPTFIYASLGVYFKKSLFMPYLKNAVLIRYEVVNTLNEPIIMNLTPLINSRHFFQVTKKNEQNLDFKQEQISNGVIIGIQPGIYSLALSSTAGYYLPDKNIWLEKMYYRKDDLRGEQCLDDNYQPGTFFIDFLPKENKTFYLAIFCNETNNDSTPSSSIITDKTAQIMYTRELRRKNKLIRQFYRQNIKLKEEDWLKWLILSTDSFIVSRKSTGKKSIIAGYHWFEDWGRDALISIPGLTLITGRQRDAEEILLTFKQYCKNGLVPNRFPDQEGDKPVYDSVDTTLWFIYVILQYLKYTQNFDFIQRELWETLQNILENHIQGTLFGIHLDRDGLLNHGSRLTWMDVSINGEALTPRQGKAVEIQALWYNALKIMEFLSSKFGNKDAAQKYLTIATKAKKSFNEKFWNFDQNYLFDSINGKYQDSSLRSNQIIVAFLDFSILDNIRTAMVVDTVWKRLWSHYGLKTLSSDNPRYIGQYKGDLYHRDLSYHNGTIWAWQLGSFVTAFLKTKKHASFWRKFAFTEFMTPLFLEELYYSGLGTLSEVFSGDYPHNSDGCISQAWSVAEPLRAFIEDVLMKRPSYEKQIFDF